MTRQTAARHLVDSLVINEITHVFCVPGESYLPVLDALYDVRDRIQLISCRHEAAAANMAEAYGKLTGRPGVCMVTRGPGATQGAVGVHTAFQDSTPMIYLIGQVARSMMDREAFQEIDYRQFFASTAKWAGQIDQASRVTEYMHRAFATAINGRRGPVVLALPEDMLAEEADAPAPLRVVETPPAAGPKAMLQFERLLREARRPLLLVGGGGWSLLATERLKTFVQDTGLPVAATFRSKDLIDNCHPNYIGDVGIAPNPALADRIRASDLLIALGPRLGEMTTSGYELIRAPNPEQGLIHIHPGADELGRVYWADVAINASPDRFLVEANRRRRDPNAAWATQAHEGHEAYQAFSTPIEVKEGVNLSSVFGQLGDLAGPKAIICNGAGNYAAWLHRFHRHRGYKTQLAPTSGAMGYGFPAALAAKAAQPDRTVVCVAGDGCFMMASNELATAMQYNLPVIVLVVNNGSYGTIRMHQERDYPGRISGTNLVNPDFKAYAESFGAHGERVANDDAFPDAFERARKSGKPAVIELVTSAREIAPGRRLG
ncbi:MAG: thiamine pyrophosphate-binding protein [Alphaproteobacteria bacterium]|nr:thiamine pyrophosphate-binding protein [Alphaproteobacteria bacterium]